MTSTLPFHSIPTRPAWIYDEDLKFNVPLLYRSTIVNEDGRYCVTDPKYIRAQITLYRWVRGMDYMNQVSLRDLAKYLEMSGHILGKLLNQSLPYSPRRLKGVTKDNPQSIWLLDLHYREELQYGLEWQICVWLSLMMEKGRTIEDELDELAECEDRDVAGLFLEPTYQNIEHAELREPDWSVIAPLMRKEERHRNKLAMEFCKPPAKKVLVPISIGGKRSYAQLSADPPKSRL